MNAQELPVRISVIIPAFNEQGIIGQTVQETVRALTGCDYEIVVVDDGSHDGTRAEARQAAEGNARVQVVGYDKNEGKGWALRYGFEQTDGDLVALLDADLDLHPAQLWTLWKVMQETGADVVIGSKQHPQSRVNYPWQRRMISTAYFLLIRWLFGLPLRDTQTGLKLFRRQVLQDVFPRMQVKGFAFDLELLVAADRFGYRTVEAPVVVSFRHPYGTHVGWRTIGRVFLDTAHIFYKSSFWKWLEPSPRDKFWMLTLVAGLMTAGFGAAHWLALHVISKSSTLARILTLQFMDTRVRDWLMIGLGSILVILALVALNKSLLKAFTRPDRGDLAGIIRRHITADIEETQKQ